MKGFASDNWAGAHPEVLAALTAVNDGHVHAYGDDPHTEKAQELLKHHFGDHAQPFLVLNGSGANVSLLRALCTRPYHAVICTVGAHIDVDEAGAAEWIGGIKLIDVPTTDGKLTPDHVTPYIRRIGDEHAVQPRVISIGQSTELGTVYTPAEIAALADLAHANDMYLHVDGARLANAVASLDATLSAITTDAGVDAVSFGGTKNGILLGEAAVLLRPDLAPDFKWIRKQTLQLASKQRYVAAQFIALLEDGLWQRSAAHANAMAARLAKAIADVAHVRITQPVQANVVFAIVDPELTQRLQRSSSSTSGTSAAARCAGCARGTRPRKRWTRSRRRSQRAELERAGVQRRAPDRPEPRGRRRGGRLRLPLRGRHRQRGPDDSRTPVRLGPARVVGAGDRPRRPVRPWRL